MINFFRRTSKKMADDNRPLKLAIEKELKNNQNCLNLSGSGIIDIQNPINN